MSIPVVSSIAVKAELLAAKVARGITGQSPSKVRRFATGTSHYVFEALFVNRAPIVVRIGDQSAVTAMEGARHLSSLLKPLGVPLPEILAVDLSGELPWLALERLPGTDLGDVIADLTGVQLGA